MSNGKKKRVSPKRKKPLKPSYPKKWKKPSGTVPSYKPTQKEKKEYKAAVKTASKKTAQKKRTAKKKR